MSGVILLPTVRSKSMTFEKWAEKWIKDIGDGIEKDIEWKINKATVYLTRRYGNDAIQGNDFRKSSNTTLYKMFNLLIDKEWIVLVNKKTQIYIVSKGDYRLI